MTDRKDGKMKGKARYVIGLAALAALAVAVICYSVGSAGGGNGQEPERKAEAVKISEDRVEGLSQIPFTSDADEQGFLSAMGSYAKGLGLSDDDGFAVVKVDAASGAAERVYLSLAKSRTYHVAARNAEGVWAPSLLSSTVEGVNDAPKVEGQDQQQSQQQSQQTQETPASEPAAPATDYVPPSSEKATAVLGASAPKRLVLDLGAWLEAKGYDLDASSVQVDAASFEKSGGKVEFYCKVGSAAFDAELDVSSGRYGFRAA